MTDSSPPDLGRPRPFAHYDRRGYRTVGVEEGYAEWSRIYSDFDRRFDLDLFEASTLLRERLPGAAVVDLGCGTGRIGEHARGRGARSVVGVDRSSHMLEGARLRGEYDELALGDMCITRLEAKRFDGVLTSMSLCHVEDLPEFYAEARRLVRDEGWLCIVDFHPFFLFQGIPSHFSHPDTGEHIAVHNFIHGLGDHFGAARRAGFEVVELEERYVTDEWAEAKPAYDKFLGWPVTFMMSARVAS